MIDGRLFINAYEYYDADGNVTNTTLIVDQPDQLSSSIVRGYFDLLGGAGHTSGWISEIPSEWQALLGGTHLTGQSSGIPIISRCSVGPSAFAFTPDTVSSTCGEISTIALMDFNLSNPLHSDLDNSSGSNNLWTHLSRATFGLIVPGTRSYLTIGYSGGHNSGVCYKCTQDNGNLCGGYCAPQASDYHQYYWLWDVNDLLAVKTGVLTSYEVRPYDYGVLNTPFENSHHEIGGGTYDAVHNILYLSIQKADTLQGTYSNPPVIVGYKLNADSCVACCPSNVWLHTSDIYSGMQIFSNDYIKSDAIINGNISVSWSASSYVELLPPFVITEGSSLEIKIQNCPE